MGDPLVPDLAVGDGSAGARTVRRFGVVAVVSAVLWILIVAVLHVVRSDLDPVETYISDYAIGEHGWLMATAFVIVGTGMMCLSVGLRAALVPAERVQLGVALVAVTGLGFILAGLFTTDPTGADETSTEGSLHLLGAVLVFPVTIANAFVLRGVFRRDPSWAPFAARWRWAPWVLLVGMVAARGSPEEIVGLTQRVFAAVIIGWYTAVALAVVGRRSVSRARPSPRRSRRRSVSARGPARTRRRGRRRGR